MSHPIAVVAVVEALPGCEKKVEAAIRTCVLATRQEPGCLFYTCHTDMNIPGRFVFIERWTSQEALATHKTTPHLLALGDALTSLLAAPLQVSVLQELA